MPLYTWVDTISGTKVDVLRKFSEYERAPEDDEIPESLRDKETKWVREVGSNTTVTKGNGWGSGKGYWMRRKEHE